MVLYCTVLYDILHIHIHAHIHIYIYTCIHITCVIVSNITLNFILSCLSCGTNKPTCRTAILPTSLSKKLQMLPKLACRMTSAKRGVNKLGGGGLSLLDKFPRCSDCKCFRNPAQ